jgi:hypothetical protein
VLLGVAVPAAVHPEAAGAGGDGACGLVRAGQLGVAGAAKPGGVLVCLLGEDGGAAGGSLLGPIGGDPGGDPASSGPRTCWQWIDQAAWARACSSWWCSC